MDHSEGTAEVGSTEARYEPFALSGVGNVNVVMMCLVIKWQ